MELNLMRLLADKQEANQEVALVTVIASEGGQCCGIGAMMLVDSNGEVLCGSIGDGQLQDIAQKEALTCIKRGLSRKALLNQGDRSVEVFTNAFCSSDRLIITGSGNVALNIYKFARILGYRITLVDNRVEMLTRVNFPEAERLLLRDIVEKLGSCDIDENTCIVIATHHHEFDEPALKAVISSSARYIGMIGNHRRVMACLDHMRATGIAEESINRVYSPIGLDLGGKRTAEIALAVIAEIQAVKHRRGGGFCRSQK